MYKSVLKMVILYFFREKIICKETKHTFLSLYAPLSFINSWNHPGMMSIICPAISMCKEKYIRNFIKALCIYIYIANEVCHIRNLNFFLYIFLNKDGTWKIHRVSVTCQPVYLSLQLRYKWNYFSWININIHLSRVDSICPQKQFSRIKILSFYYRE